MTSRARSAAGLMLGWIALLWVLEGVDLVSGNALDSLGIQPRDLGGLADVVPAAFIHFGFGHLAANTLPLLVLGFVAALRTGVRRFLAVVLLIILVSGVGVWLTAAPHSNTAGASGVVFGLFGFLLVRGFIERKLLDVGIGVAVGVVYGSIVWGALPTDSGISWQAHLFGLIGGVLAAFVCRERGRAVTAGAAVRPVP
ncbi:rhomboid family intramembrane serine protease [Streptomyces sp. CT34]|uniref:rhomboid family intramembrane serine protease n=1 Tax=Streptomyces sp. CT34 TaxID=1553907 RepID=UPI0005BB480B|nr:rhomboid family intramembrane serine protease [Streptomyces sp. CT34]